MTAEDDILLIEAEGDEDEVAIVYDIATYPSDLTLSVIHEQWRRQDIVIPEFQREFVWNIKQSSLLIESFLMGLPVPPVFFYVDDDNKNLVIDGQQRIRSIMYFFDGYFGRESEQGKKQVFRLKGLSERSPYHNKRMDDLKESDQRKLRGSVLRAINIRQLSPRKDTTSVYHIFERLNTGGTALKPQEIRNCVFRGEFANRLRDMNSNVYWRKILGRLVHDRHQTDVEVILRVIALAERLQEYEKPMKEFLNIYMKDNRTLPQRVEGICLKFEEACKIVVRELGEKPFNIRGPVNSSVLDAVLCTIINAKQRVPRDLKERFEKLLKSNDFDKTTWAGTTDAAAVKTRHRIAKEFLLGR